jgi:hypothetical protein
MSGRHASPGAITMLTVMLVLASLCVFLAWRVQQLERGTIIVGKSRVLFLDVYSGSRK